MGNFFSKFTDTQIYWITDQDRSDFLDDVKTFINTGVCLQYKNKMLYLPLVWDQKTVDIAKKLRVNHTTARSAVHRMSCDLYDKFGQDFFIDVADDLQFAIDRFNMVQKFNGLDTLFIPGFTSLIAELVEDTAVFDPDISLIDCQEELHFLKNYTEAGVKGGMQGFNRDSLRYVLSLLQGSKGSAEARYNLINYLMH